MNNKKVKEIIKFSFYKNIQNKWFIIFNIITLLSIVFILNWGNISSLFTSSSEQEIFKVEVLDTENIVYDSFLSSQENNNDVEISRATSNEYTAENIPDDFMLIEVIPDEQSIFNLKVISKEGISVDIYTPLIDSLNEIRNNLFTEKYGISNDTLNILQSEINVERIMLGVDADDSYAKEMIKLFSSALTYLITLIIFSKMANDIAQEKQSKSSEYILTTVSAKEYLFAKIFSNIAILIVQGLLLFSYYFIAVCVLNISRFSGTDISLSSGMLSSALSIDIVKYFIVLLVFNILSLILLCIIQATLSSKTSSTMEASNTVSLLVFVMMAAYIASVYLITPYSKVNLLMYVISCVPLLSAYFVPAMMVVGQATTLQILISALLLLISIPIVFKYCSKIFKNGILDYTKVKKKDEKVLDKKSEIKKFLTKREMRNVGFVLGMAILIYIGSQVVLTLIANLVLPTLLKPFFSEADILMIMQILLQILSIGLSALFVFAYCDKKEIAPRKVSTFGKVRIVFIALLLIIVLQVALSLILYPILGLDYDVTDMLNISNNTNLLSKLIVVIALAVVPAIFEELLFRKALIDFLSKYGKTFALLASALLFGLIHMNLSQGLFAFIIGIIFGTIYLYTKDIKLTMLIHFLNNGYAALAMILPTIGIFLVGLLLILVFAFAIAFLIISIILPSSRKTFLKFFKAKVDLSLINSKYKYVFTDFIFDVSLILVFAMSIVTENILR